jgi:catechol 2,3-dioxygenase-like lactoylglutathione lyase family enzyme
VGISVPDVDEAVLFFNAILGGDPPPAEDVPFAHVGEITGYPGAHMRIAMMPIPHSEVLLELIEYIQPASGRVDMETYNAGNTHVGFAVDDIEGAYQRLLAIPDGLVHFRSKGPVEAYVGSLTGSKFMYMRGPGGITVELCQLARGTKPSP